MYEYICISPLPSSQEEHCKFTTVSYTEEIPQEALEALQQMECLADPASFSDPRILSARLFYCNGEVYPLLTHISPSSDGEERVAHHLVFRNEKELALCPGLAPGILRCDNFCTNWELLPEKLPMRMHLKSRKRLAHRAYQWEALLGDAGWAGVIAERFLAAPENPLYLEYPPEFIDCYGILELVNEVLFLLPPEERLKFTFTTEFTGEMIHCSCYLRAIPAGSPRLNEIRNIDGVQILSQENSTVIPPEFANSPLVNAAREMKPEKPAIPTASTLAATEEPPEFSPTQAAPLLHGSRKVPTLQKTPLPSQQSKGNWILYVVAAFLTLMLIWLVYIYIRTVNSSGEEKEVFVIRENMRIN